MIKRSLPLVSALALAVAVGAASVDAVAQEAKSKMFWWPEQLDLTPLRDHDQAEVRA